MLTLMRSSDFGAETTAATRSLILSEDEAKMTRSGAFGGGPVTTLLLRTCRHNPRPGHNQPVRAFGGGARSGIPPGRSAAGSDLAQEATRGRKEETFPRVGWL